MVKFLICFGADNEYWLCDADDRDHAMEQFLNADMDGDVNHFFVCYETQIPDNGA